MGAASRRGFLSGLASLPLIGGSVALLGTPTAVAATCTDATMLNYTAWLAYEHRAALEEQAKRTAINQGCDQVYADEIADIVRRCPNLYWLPDAPHVEAAVKIQPPSSRAALVLSAVGCDWRGR